MSDWIDVPRARLRVRADGIAEVQHDAHVLYTGPLARGHIETLQGLLEERRAPLLVVVGEGFRLDDEARAVLLKSDAVRDTFTCGAMLFAKRAEALAVNIFLKLARPVRPMKAFAREADALGWLRSQ